MGRDGGDAGGVFFGDSDGVFMEPAEAEGDGLFDPTNAHFHITLQKAGLHFFSAFGTIHGMFSFLMFMVPICLFASEDVERKLLKKGTALASGSEKTWYS